MKIELNLISPESWMTNEYGIYDCYVRPTEGKNLGQIPNGINPRDLDEKSKKLKDIEATFLKNDNSFLADNGGMQILINKGSLSIDDNIISFTCEGKDFGHYDGQHTQYAVDKAIEKMKGQQIKNECRLSLIEAEVDSDGEVDVLKIRSSAQNINNRTPQKISSEMHIQGWFTKIKSSISYTDIENIGWKQNQKNVKGKKIKAENEVQQLIRLLSTFFPSSDTQGVTLPNICKLAKGGETTVMKMFKNPEFSSCVQPSLKYTDYVLELSDFIQEKLKEVLGDEHKHFDLIKGCSKAQMDNSVGARPYFKNTTWRGERIEGALDKDFILMFVFAMINNCFEWDEIKQKYICHYKIDEAKAIWLEYGKDLLNIANNKFKESFSSSFQSRKSDFVNQDALWGKLAKALNKKMRLGSWKERVKVTLKQVA